MKLVAIFAFAGLWMMSCPSAGSAQGEVKMTPYGGKAEKALFAGGCFWCMEKPFESLDGVLAVISGYTAIFYLNDEQKRLAEESKKRLQGRGVFDKPIVTPILPAQAFHPAEEYHQDYYRKNPLRYTYYRGNSGAGPVP